MIIDTSPTRILYMNLIGFEQDPYLSDPSSAQGTGELRSVALHSSSVVLPLKKKGACMAPDTITSSGPIVLPCRHFHQAAPQHVKSVSGKLPTQPLEVICLA